MFNLKRNQVIITVLVFMIAIAAYLNTQQAPNVKDGNYVADSSITGDNTAEETDLFSGYDETASTNSQVVATNDQTVENKQPVAHTEEIAVPSEEAQLTTADANTSDSFTAIITKKAEELTDTANVAASKNLDVNYFAEEKLLREQSRAAQIEQLSQYVANENLDQDSKSKAAANLLQIQERIEKESSAEALLRAKGFQEVYVRIDDDTVDVVVNKAELSDTDIAQIEEIVNRKTGYSVGKINITPLNGIAKK
ncbi:SpoIIIAH-like family protein [Cellulosilyticum lentocellum]|uniref:Stage III sporulation protein AH n=1 Tax=Cellulosilyticum lentocellum (strain ATCC 49066 / DSM 5427 / NCIMB 11756 / RHM5) TaxID=642492 RepID=F2JME8_CELLD|nr:SpoIIIAH-like family protein [Cellulosilyticum lentocellum]ADZ83466.1 hypothetical protein Clole_1742 [Cellulosilyticum lentocellum DSM 5427]